MRQTAAPEASAAVLRAHDRWRSMAVSLNALTSCPRGGGLTAACRCGYLERQQVGVSDQVSGAGHAEMIVIKVVRHAAC